MMRIKGEALEPSDSLALPRFLPVWSGRHSRRTFLQWGGGLVAWAALAARPRDGHAELPNRPSTSRAVQEQAVREMPINSLPEPIRSKIQQIVAHPTIFRRLPVEVIPCDAELHVFLVRYPEVIVNMWQLMGVTNVVIKRTSAYTYDAQDGAGTVSQVELVYGTREKHLFMAEGYYEGPLLARRVTGRCVLLLTSAYSHDAHARAFVSNRLDVFVQLDNVGAEIVAKTLHPLMGRTIDRNFAESARFVGQVSHVAETNGPGVQRLISRLDNIDSSVRAQFTQITSVMNQRALLRNMGNAEGGGEPQHVSDRRGDGPMRAVVEK